MVLQDTRAVKLLLAVFIGLQLPGQAPSSATASAPEVSAEVHMKAVKLIEASGARDRLVAAIPDLIGQGTAAMQKQCPDCKREFFEEWGKRMTARLKIDEFVSVAVRAYEKRFTLDELTEFLSVANSRKTDHPLTLSPALQKKVMDLMPAIMGEMTGGCTEIGARLGGEIGAEIEREHPEYLPPKPKPAKP
jgi:hypothetical protein